jgi:glycosyltransferase involved in cell wall biosynthesis
MQGSIACLRAAASPTRPATRVFVWQWSRFGGPPLVAVALARGLAGLPGVETALSLSSAAELLHGPNPPPCELPVETYSNRLGFLSRLAASPLAALPLAHRVAALQPDIALCAQPGPLDLRMAWALARAKVPMVVLVHDAEHHPGDGQPLQMQLQRALCRRAAAVGAFSAHVAGMLQQQGLAGTPERPLIRLRLPPLPVAVPPAAPRTDDAVRVLCFGRLLHYKGLDLLAEAVARLGAAPWLRLRVAGAGPESPELQRLRSLPNVTVENRWVPETELGGLLAWADALVLPYREASQSGVAALALAAGRRVIATSVGGLPEQLGDEPLATLCAPEPDRLAAALGGLLQAPPRPAAPRRDPDAAWRATAAILVQQIAPLLRAA